MVVVAAQLPFGACIVGTCHVDPRRDGRIACREGHAAADARIELTHPHKRTFDYATVTHHRNALTGMARGDFDADMARQGQFFERHIQPWAARFFADLETTGAANFYKSVGRVGRTFIELETEAFKLPH